MYYGVTRGLMRVDLSILHRRKGLNRKTCKDQSQRIFRSASDGNFKTTLKWSFSRLFEGQRGVVFFSMTILFLITFRSSERAPNFTLNYDVSEFFEMTSSAGNNPMLWLKSIEDYFEWKDLDEKIVVNKVAGFSSEKTHQIWTLKSNSSRL